MAPEPFKQNGPQQFKQAGLPQDPAAPAPQAPGQGDFVSTGNVLRTDKTLVVKGFFTANDQEAQMLRGLRIGRVAVTGNYTTALMDYLVAVTSLAVSSSIGLPDPRIVGPGKLYLIKDEAGGAATTNITIRSDGERNIDGSSSTTLSTNFQSKEFYTDGNNWYTK